MLFRGPIYACLINQLEGGLKLGEKLHTLPFTVTVLWADCIDANIRSEHIPTSEHSGALLPITAFSAPLEEMGHPNPNPPIWPAPRSDSIHFATYVQTPEGGSQSPSVPDSEWCEFILPILAT